VVVLGEVLVELSSREPLADGATLRLGFSGDALNAAAAAAAAGAHTGLVARVPDDELGDQLVQRVAELGVDTRWVVRAPGQHGLYLTHADPQGARQFTYVRGGSVGSGLTAADLDEDLLASAGVVVASGVACAVSDSLAGAVHRAAEAARRFLYDPNYRPRLTTSARAAESLRRLAPLAEVVTPSWPDEAQHLLDLPPDAGVDDALTAVAALGARGVVLTCGPDGAVVAANGVVTDVPGTPAPAVVDQTGAGDCLAGTLAARLALGDRLLDAVALATAAAALSVGGQGGTGRVPTLTETRELLAAARPVEELNPR
jgi:2-dehydro-3-deoxygluconokinase